MLKIENLSVSVKGKELLNDVSIDIKKGTATGLTGKSGSGKTTLIKAIMGILDYGVKVSSGEIYFEGSKLVNLPDKVRRQFVGTKIGFIPQNAMRAFDPRIKIGKQIVETFKKKLGLRKKEAAILAKKLLEELNLKDSSRVFESYPFQLSGGMLQRVVIAILIGLNPDYILADEPSSALDVENRKILIDVLIKQREKSGILLISHDVELLQKLCKTVYILENGCIIEKGNMFSLLENPKQLWTRKFADVYKKQGEEKWQWKEYK